MTKALRKRLAIEQSENEMRPNAGRPNLKFATFRSML